MDKLSSQTVYRTGGPVKIYPFSVANKFLPAQTKIENKRSEEILGKYRENNKGKLKTLNKAINGDLPQIRKLDRENSIHANFKDWMANL
jgi:hypothetical protein